MRRPAPEEGYYLRMQLLHQIYKVVRVNQGDVPSVDLVFLQCCFNKASSFYFTAQACFARHRCGLSYTWALPLMNKAFVPPVIGHKGKAVCLQNQRNRRASRFAFLLLSYRVLRSIYKSRCSFQCYGFSSFWS